MNIDLSSLDFSFSSKPLVIGGKAMEYYGLRKAGPDVDLVITREDYARLAEKYPDHRKELWGDRGVCKDGFEIWQTICLFDYECLSEKAITVGDAIVVSLEKLLFLKALGIKIPKNENDLRLIAKKILDEQYKDQARTESMA